MVRVTLAEQIAEVGLRREAAIMAAARSQAKGERG
jgi:hypothetical protein